MLEMILMTILCYICIYTYNFIKNSKTQSVKGQKILEFSKECWDKIKKVDTKLVLQDLKKPLIFGAIFITRQK